MDSNVEAAMTAPGEWHPLPDRARTLYVIGGLWWALPPLALAFAGVTFGDAAPGATGAWLAGAAIVGALFGCWRGWRVWKRTGWMLDEAGFSLRRGQWWYRETRVPQSRVQHLDVRRGPLQRRFGLSTLVIHTAGTRHNAVSVDGLDADDAQRLRDALARQDDDDDAD